MSSELINTIPNVFDAICINTQGKELFSKDDIEGFFKIFKSLEHCKALTKGHCALACGTGMDELIRHHPDIKDAFMECFMKMTKDLCREIIPAQAAFGLKIPVLIYENPSPTPDTTYFASGSDGSRDNVTKGLYEEEKNPPAILFTRSLLSVCHIS